MKIKSIYIEGFGGLSDFSYTFNDEVNIIKFNNEQGKTIMAEFIRAMLYGISSGVRNIKNNPRKKYMPWGKANMGGELLLECDGKEYLIIRTFGERKGDDRINVIDNITGESVIEYCTDCPFYEMTGIGADAFDKALYLNHLSVDMDSKKDEITDKLVTLSQTGDEEFSYKRASKVLEEAIKELSGRNGKINKVNDSLDSYYKELDENKKSLENIAYIKDKNLNLEKQEQQLKNDGGSPFKRYGALWAVMLVVSACLHFVTPWLTAVGLLVTAVLAVKVIFDNKEKQKDKINRLLEISREIGENKGKIHNNQEIDLSATENKIAETKKLIEAYEQKLNDLILTKESLDNAFDKIQQGFGTRLNESVAEILSVITNGGYDGVKVDKNFQMLVHCKDGWQSAQYLSDGAYSQIYFALKMSIVKMLFDKMPIILDDPFVLYDEKRLKRAMEYLSNCDSQVILFTR